MALKFPENLDYPFQTEDLLKYHDLSEDNFANNNNILQTQYINTLNEIDNATNFELYSDKYSKLASLKQKQLVFRAFAMIWNFNVTYQQNFFSTGTGFNITQGNITQAQTYNSQRPQLFSMAFHLLKQAGFYNELNLINTTKNVGDPESNGNLTATYVVGDQNEYLRWNEARKYWVRGDNFISSDKSVKIKFDNSTFAGILDLSASTVSPEHDFGDSLKKIDHKWEVVKIKSLDGAENLTYETFEYTFNNIILGSNFISKSPDLDIKFIPHDKKNFPKLEFTLKTHKEAFGDSLKEIDNKWEVVKLKSFDGEQNFTFDKWQIAMMHLQPLINFFSKDSVKFWQTALNDKTISYYYHTDGEFSFHYWQNPSLITTYKKPEAYVFTQLFGINQNPAITDWSPYIEYDFNANTGEVDFKLASFKKTGAGWGQKTYLVIKTEEGDTTFDLKKNPLTFKFKERSYDIQSLLDKIHDRPENKEIIFSKEVLNWKRTNSNIIESGNTIEVHELNDIIDNNKWVGATFQFHFDYCAGKESTLHGEKYRYNVYRIVFIADKLPALNTSTWTKVYKMDYQVQWFLGNRGELKYEEFEDCSEGAPTVELKLETIGYYLKFTFNGFKRAWCDQTINFKQKSLWNRFKIIADVYK